MAVDVFVIAPIRLHRETLSAALDAAADITVIGEAASFEEAVPQLVGRDRPAVALLDVRQPANDLPVAVSPTRGPDTRVVAVGIPEDEAVSWVEAGISGFVPRDASLDEAITALEKVANGEFTAPPEVTAQLASRLRRLASESSAVIPEDQLTTREREVLDLVAEGLSNKAIAQKLSIQEQTVKNHVHRVLAKLGVTRRTEAVARTKRPP